MTVPFGAFELRCDLPGDLDVAALAPWLGRHVHDPDAVSEAVHVHVDHEGPALPGLTPKVRFRPTGPDRYVDESEVWDATLDGFDAAEAPVARVRVRPNVDRPALWGRVFRMITRVVASAAAVRHDALLVHGCALVDPETGGAALFLGASGHGKTTMRKRLADWTCLSDDTVLVSLDAVGGLWVRGTPLSGREHHPTLGRAVRLAHTLRLEPGAASLEVVALDRAAVFETLLARTFCFVEDGPLRARTLDLVERVSARLPLAALRQSLHHDVAARPWRGAAC